MPLSKETKDRIEQEADNISRIPEIQQGYEMGAEAEAERSAEVIDLYKQLVDLQNDELNAMESFTKGYVADRERVAKAIDLRSRIKIALTKYNNSKKG